MQTPDTHSEKKSTSNNGHPVLTLLSVVLMITGVWGVVLPRIADLPALQEKIEHLDQKGINPNAFFYTDHPNAFNNN